MALTFTSEENGDVGVVAGMGIRRRELAITHLINLINKPYERAAILGLAAILKPGWQPKHGLAISARLLHESKGAEDRMWCIREKVKEVPGDN